jgi:polysaccharide biosynthesis transport protein
MAEKPRAVPPPPSEVQPVRRIRPSPAEPRADLQDTLSILWLYKWSILATALLVLGLVLLVSSSQTPVYESTAGVLVETVLDVGSDAVTPRDPNLATEVELVTSAAVADIVADDLGFSGNPRTLLDDVSVERPIDTEILEISYRHVDPEEARRRAQGFADGYLEYRQQTITSEIDAAATALDDELKVLRDRLSDIQETIVGLAEDDPLLPTLDSEAALIQDLILERQLARLALTRGSVRVGEVVQPALVPRSPASPNHMVNGTLGLAAGVALGLGLAFLRNRRSGRIRSSSEIEDHIQAPVLGSIPRVPAWRHRKDAYLVTLRQWQSPGSEAFRTLRTNLLSAVSAHGVRTVVVTSAHDGEGKSAVAANLAVVLARASKRVTLVSADLRRPRLHLFFGSNGTLGLADVLAGRVQANHALQEITLATSPWNELSAVRVRLLPSGAVPENPAELLASPALEELLGWLSEGSDIVLIDAPPILPVTDALVVSRIADAVLFVIGPKSSTYSLLTSSRQQLDKVGASLIGAVLNGPHPSTTRTYGY